MRIAIVTVLPREFPLQAFVETSETLHRAAAALGHESVEAREFYPKRLNVVLGANKLKLSPGLPPAMVVYNLEQIFPGSKWLDPEYLEMMRRYPVWDYSEQNIAELGKLGIQARLVPLGYVPELTRIARRDDEDIDVLFYGSLNERRAPPINRMYAMGLRVATPFLVFGEERDALIARSRIVLNIHRHDERVFEVVRIAYLLANGRFVLCEGGGDPAAKAPFEGGLAFAAYDELPRACAYWVGREA
jgi:hypothetical protein